MNEKFELDLVHSCRHSKWLTSSLILVGFLVGFCLDRVIMVLVK